MTTKKDIAIIKRNLREHKNHCVYKDSFFKINSKLLEGDCTAFVSPYAIFASKEWECEEFASADAKATDAVKSILDSFENNEHSCCIALNLDDIKAFKKLKTNKPYIIKRTMYNKETVTIGLNPQRLIDAMEFTKSNLVITRAKSGACKSELLFFNANLGRLVFLLPVNVSEKEEANYTENANHNESEKDSSNAKKEKTMKSRKYFSNCTTAEELKKEYKTLAKELHPDSNKDSDTTELFKEMKAQFEKAWEKLKDKHKTKDGKEYTKATTETAGMFMDIIEKLLSMDGCTVEMCGSWIWVSGNTKTHKDTLKAMGFKFSRNKLAWYYHEGEYVKRAKSNYSMNDIRNMWGSTQFEKSENESKEYAQING